MEDSVTYQAILAEGEARAEARGFVKGLKRALLRVGRQRFGPPSPAIKATVNQMENLRQLEHLCEHFFEVESWEELLSSPAPRRPARKRQRRS
jgi:hypothetical protein